MTIVAAVELEDGGTLFASDSKVSGYGRGMTTGKWWVFPHCVIGEAGSDMYLQRLRASLPDTFFGREFLMYKIHEMQDELCKEGIEPLEMLVLYKGAEDGLYVLGGDGGCLGPYMDFVSIGSPSSVVNGILEYALKPARMKVKTKGRVEKVVLDAFRIAQKSPEGDDIGPPWRTEVFYR